MSVARNVISDCLALAGHEGGLRLLVLATLLLSLPGCANEQGDTAHARPSKQVDEPVWRPWAPVAIDESALSFSSSPANDPHEFFRMFEQRAEARRRGEFESAEEFQERTSDHVALLAPLSMTSKYAFAVKGRLSYDPKAEIYSSYSGEWCSREYPFEGWIACQVGTHTETEEMYVGSNAFGVTTEIKRERGRKYYLLFPLRGTSERALRRRSQSYALPIKCPVEIERARIVKDAVSVLVVGKLGEIAWVKGLPDFSEPTIHRPYDEFYEQFGIPFTLTEVICYGGPSGEVLHASRYG